MTASKPAAPALVRVLTTMHNAWIIGSAALPDVTSPRDWDVLVPFDQWSRGGYARAAWHPQSGVRLVRVP